MDKLPDEILKLCFKFSGIFFIKKCRREKGFTTLNPKILSQRFRRIQIIYWDSKQQKDFPIICLSSGYYRFIGETVQNRLFIHNRHYDFKFQIIEKIINFKYWKPLAYILIETNTKHAIGLSYNEYTIQK